MRQAKDSVKFMQVLSKPFFHRLQVEAKARGITVQELLRSILIPDWLREYNGRLAKRRHSK